MKVAVTGAFSYTGRYLSRLLLDQGNSVVNLSNRTKPFALSPLAQSDIDSIKTHPLLFDQGEDNMEKAMEGCDVLYCTYWIRFAEGSLTHDVAVNRVRELFEAARKVGVKRIIFSTHT